MLLIDTAVDINTQYAYMNLNSPYFHARTDVQIVSFHRHKQTSTFSRSHLWLKKLRDEGGVTAYPPGRLR